MQQIYLRRIDGYVIRQCTYEDLQQVILLNLAMLPEHYSEFFFEEILKESNETFLVAEKDGQVVGYIMCRVEYGFPTARRFGLARKGHIVSLAVMDADRRRGVGQALVEGVLKAMKDRGCTEAYLEVRASNTPATLLYKKLRFNTISKFKGYYKDGEDALLMSLRL